MSDKGRAWVDFLGVLVFLLPLCIFLALRAWDFVAVSWAMGETSRESGGLPYPLLPLLKTVLILMPAAVGLQGVSLALKSLKTITDR
jgi:TRAP-type mannitol/chloroaromatic compound transport system permease small subunit